MNQIEKKNEPITFYFSSAQHSSKRKTRQNARELELKTKGNQQVQENKDPKEAANVMMMLVRDAEETMKIFT